MESLEKEIVERLSVLETKMDMVISAVKSNKLMNNNSQSFSKKDKIQLGALIIAATALINVATKLLQAYLGT